MTKDFEREIIWLKSVNADLLKALYATQYGDHGDDGHNECPVCFASILWDDGHKEDCIVGKAISRAEGLK